MGANDSFFCSVFESAYRRSQLFLRRMFFSCSAHWAAAGALLRLFQSAGSLGRSRDFGGDCDHGKRTDDRHGAPQSIETLTLCDHGENYCMTRIPGADLERVERDLRNRNVTGVWTTVSFVYPLLFECGEEFA